MGVDSDANKPSFPPNAMFAPTFHCLIAQDAAACPQCVWNEVLAGLTEEDARPIALMALVINPLSNICSFAGWQKCQKAVHTKCCVAFSFMAALLQANLCPCSGFLAVELVLERMGCSESVPWLRPLREQRTGT